MPACLIDENLPLQLAQDARDQGHAARWVRDLMPGADDRVLFDELRSSGERLVTRDVQFANMGNRGIDSRCRAHSRRADAARPSSLAAVCGAGGISESVACGVGAA